MKLVRFSFLENTDLMEASNNRVFESAKDFIVEALAIRLNPQAAHDEPDKYKLNLEPRVLYQPERPDYITLPDGSQVPGPDGPVLDWEGQEVLGQEGEDPEEEVTATGPVDPDTHLPQTAINAKDGLPISLPMGTEMFDKASGVKNIFFDPESKQFDADAMPSSGML